MVSRPAVNHSSRLLVQSWSARAVRVGKRSVGSDRKNAWSLRWVAVSRIRCFLVESGVEQHERPEAVEDVESTTRHLATLSLARSASPNCWARGRCTSLFLRAYSSFDGTRDAWTRTTMSSLASQR